jgi:hypothetical protein
VRETRDGKRYAIAEGGEALMQLAARIYKAAGEFSEGNHTETRLVADQDDVAR